MFNGFIRDITDKIAAEEQLRQPQKMEAVGQLTGGIAHDFNNMLTVITGTIEILAEAVADRPQLAAIAKMIDEAAERGAELTQHLLAFARKQPLQPREIDVNTLIVDAAKLLRPTLGEHVEIESMLEDDAWPALVDPTQLTTALLNLALNARDAMPDGGKLTLETGNVVLDEDYASAHSEVSARPLCDDRGERHRRRHPGGDPRQGVRAVLHDQGGRQGHRPRAEHGLRLRQAIGRAHQDLQRGRPRHDDQDVSAAPATGASGRRGDASPVPLEGGNETILVVEDDALVRDLCARRSCRASATRTLDGGECGARRCRSSIAAPKFDLLFTDVIMPGRMNGRQLADEIGNAPARHQGAVHLRLHRERDHPSRPARLRRAAAGQAVSQVGSGATWYGPRSAGEDWHFEARAKRAMTRERRHSSRRPCESRDP